MTSQTIFFFILFVSYKHRLLNYRYIYKLTIKCLRNYRFCFFLVFVFHINSRKNLQYSSLKYIEYGCFNIFTFIIRCTVNTYNDTFMIKLSDYESRGTEMIISNFSVQITRKSFLLWFLFSKGFWVLFCFVLLCFL